MTLSVRMNYQIWCARWTVQKSGAIDYSISLNSSTFLPRALPATRSTSHSQHTTNHHFMFTAYQLKSYKHCSNLDSATFSEMMYKPMCFAMPLTLAYFGVLNLFTPGFLQFMRCRGGCLYWLGAIKSHEPTGCRLISQT